MVNVGFRLDMGSWNMIAACEPRIFLNSVDPRRATSTPPIVMVPPAIQPLAGSSLNTDRLTEDLPQPDSPTRPTISPRATHRLASCTASRQPPSTAYLTDTSCISSSG